MALHDWQEVLGEDGSRYYYNVVTTITAWEIPKEEYDDDPAAAYATTADMLTTIQEDEGYADDTSYGNDEQEANAAELSNQNSNNGIWEQLQTDDGQVYYYNAITGVTQWDAPAGMSAATDDALSVAAFATETVSNNGNVSSGLYSREMDETAVEAAAIPEYDKDYQEYQQRTSVITEVSTQPMLQDFSDSQKSMDINVNTTTVELVNTFGDLYMEEFVEQNFNFERNGIFRVTVTTEKLMSWKEQSIKSALLKAEGNAISYMFMYVDISASPVFVYDMLLFLFTHVCLLKD